MPISPITAAVDGALAGLRVYQEARTVVRLVYAATGELPESERQTLGDQMRRSAVSVVSNIAEGHGRASPRDKLRLFDIARGSLSELRAQLDIAADTTLLPEPRVAEIAMHSVNTARLLAGLRRSVIRRPKREATLPSRAPEPAPGPSDEGRRSSGAVDQAQPVTRS